MENRLDYLRSEIKAIEHEILRMENLFEYSPRLARFDALTNFPFSITSLDQRRKYFMRKWSEKSSEFHELNKAKTKLEDLHKKNGDDK